MLVDTFFDFRCVPSGGVSNAFWFNLWHDGFRKMVLIGPVGVMTRWPFLLSGGIENPQKEN